MSFLGEIRRRKVFKVAAVYAVVAWLIIQVVGQVSAPLSLPEWFDTVVIVLLAIGFPIALILSWAFDLTPRGIQATGPRAGGSDLRHPSGGLTYLLQGLVLAAVGFLLLDQYVLDGGSTRSDEPARAAPASSGSPLRFVVPMPDGIRYAAGEVFHRGAVVAPDGESLVFTGVDERADGARLYLKRLDSTDAQPIPGTEDANSVFWSPDGSRIGFFSDGMLKTMAIDGGGAQPIAEAGGVTGATWNEDDVILASLDNPGPVFRVYLDGREPVPVTELDVESGSDHIWPQFLPDGDRFVYLATGRTVADNRLIMASLGSDAQSELVRGITIFAVTGPDSIAYFRGGIAGGILQAQRIDLDSMQLDGQPILLAADAVPPVSASLTGAVTFRSVPSRPIAMEWIGLDGTTLRPATPPGQYLDPVISPDGTEVAYARPAAGGGGLDIWILDAETGESHQLTTHQATDRAPHWSPDGERIAFLSFRPEALGLYMKNANGIGTEELVLASPGVLWPYQWARTGELLYFAGTSGANDLWMIRPEDPESATLLLDAPNNEADAALSPSGDWIIYSANDPGRYEIYLTANPPDTTKLQVTTDGGVDPTWSRDGRTLFYIRPSTGALMAREVREGTPPRFGEPRRIHSGPFFFPDAHSFDVHPERDELIISPSFGFSGDITILLNWQQQLPAPAR